MARDMTRAKIVPPQGTSEIKIPIKGKGVQEYISMADIRILKDTLKEQGELRVTMEKKNKPVITFLAIGE